ncbi:hypothetical protein ABK040_014146 [Willaertia magna]
MSASPNEFNPTNYDRDCPPIKEQYDNCFKRWYSEDFLAGKKTDVQKVCATPYVDYQKCVKLSLKEKDLESLGKRDYRQEAKETVWEESISKK